MEWLARQIDATVKGSVLLVVVGGKVAVKSDWMENRKRCLLTVSTKRQVSRVRVKKKQQERTHQGGNSLHI